MVCLQTFLSLFVFALLKFASSTYVRTHDSSFTPDAILRVTAANVTNGCIERYSILANGTNPGPPLRFKEGSIVWVRVYNDVKDNNLTIHWHGLSQAAAPFSDGTPQASQWPIPPKHFFDYELDLKSSAPGSYFYHSHVGFQAVSCLGSLIIDDREEKPYHYEEERVILMSDVFNKTDKVIEDGLLADPFTWSGETNSILFNGVGTTTTSKVTDGQGCGVAKINVDPGKTYRFRFIGGTALSFLSMAIQGHDNLTIIEADGEYTKPHSVDFLQLANGQRFSTLLKTKTCEELSAAGDQLEYWLQAETRERPTLTRGYAQIVYSNKCGYPTKPPVKEEKIQPPPGPVLNLPKTQYDWLEYTLRPLHRNDFPEAHEVTRRVTITVQQIIEAHIIWEQNMYSWTESVEKVPYLVALYLNETQFLPSYEVATAGNATGIDPRVGAFPAKIGEVLEIVIQNEAATGGKAPGGFDAHPFHAHGAHYYDIGSGNGTYNATANEMRLAGTHPVRRDTTMLYRYTNTTSVPDVKLGWRAWRLRITDVGVFMIHCHVLQHMIMGMQTVWVMGDSSDVLKLPRPEVEGYLQYGGDVYGNETHNPRVAHYFR